MNPEPDPFPYKCMAENCYENGIYMWQRFATTEEIAKFREDGIIRPEVPDDEVRVPVYGCETHKLSPDLSWGTHQSTCTAPPTCNCEPNYPFSP